MELLRLWVLVVTHKFLVGVFSMFDGILIMLTLGTYFPSFSIKQLSRYIAAEEKLWEFKNAK